MYTLRSIAIEETLPELKVDASRGKRRRRKEENNRQADGGMQKPRKTIRQDVYRFFDAPGPKQCNSNVKVDRSGARRSKAIADVVAVTYNGEGWRTGTTRLERGSRGKVKSVMSTARVLETEFRRKPRQTHRTGCQASNRAALSSHDR